jgi:hypothetical protein
MDNDIDPKRIVLRLEEIAGYAKKDVFSNTDEFYDTFSKMKMIVDYMERENMVEKLRRAWLKQENARFLDNLAHTEDSIQFKKVSDDYLHMLSGRVLEKSIKQVMPKVNTITPLNFMTPEKKASLKKELDGIETAPAHDHRINRFKREYHLDSLCDLAEFYNKIKKENNLFNIVSNIIINSNLESILNYSYKKENDEAKLAEDYFKFITFHKNWTEAEEHLKNSFFKEFEKERKELEKSKGTIKMVNELKEIYSTCVDKSKPTVKNAIDYLESSAYIDDCISFENYKDNFEKRINLWKEVKSKITNPESCPYIADKIRMMCLEVANEKIYNSVRNLNEKLKNNGFSSKNGIKGIYVDAIEGITDIIEGELGYMATGERRHRK